MSSKKFRTGATLALLAAVFCWPGLLFGQSARLNLDAIKHLADRADEVVDITLDSKVMQLASLFMDDDDPEEADVRKMVANLKSLVVRSYEFDEEGRCRPEDLAPIRDQLQGPGWSRLAGVTSRKRDGNVEIYMFIQGDNIEGLAILALEPRELTVVYLLGTIDMKLLAELDGHLGIPEFDVDRFPRRKGGN